MKNLKRLIYSCLPVIFRSGLFRSGLFGSALLVSGFISSCGYHFEGGGYITNDVNQVSIKVLENKSSETNAGIAFTNALIREMIQKTDTKVVDESKAVAFLEGTIKSITFSALSRSSTESVTESRVSAVVDLKLIDKDGEVLWSVKNFASKEDYTVSPDTVTDETNKREAVLKIALRNAEKTISSLQNDF
jgi:outer membrane lipopolysaccharide assembly protein LptE/RlpB